MTAAITLTLLFRLRTRQTAKFSWAGSSRQPADGASFVKKRAIAWGVNPEVAEQASAVAVLEHIKIDWSTSAPVDMTVSYDGLDFVVDMRCTADLSAVQIASRSRSLVGGETDNEESAAWVGLQNYLFSVYADRKRIYKTERQIGIELQFEA